MSDFAMVATTKGTGPFQPALVIDGVEYVYHTAYANENEAEARAKDLLHRVRTFGRRLAVIEGFVTF